MLRLFVGGDVITVETTGQWFCAYQQRVHGRQSFKSQSSSSEEEEEEVEEEECEDDQALLLGLDPKEWKVGTGNVTQVQGMSYRYRECHTGTGNAT